MRPRTTLYDPDQGERDACGVGFVASTKGDGRRVLPLALDSLCRLAHRGAVGADRNTGDGAGVLTHIPYRLLANELRGDLPSPGALGVGMLFLPPDPDAATSARAVVEQVLAEEGIPFLSWRDVPVRPEAIGEYARQTQPSIHQVLVGRVDETDAAADRRLYRTRRKLDRRWTDRGIQDAYVVSFSYRTICYKGLLMADQVAVFYPDLQDPAYETTFALYHQRFSTNTTPTWRRAQPFRLLAHNGEINTLQGNTNWMRAREPSLGSAYWDPAASGPLVDQPGMDSATLDNALEVVSLSGRDIRHAVMMLIPEAWESTPDVDEARQAFYRYHSCLVEPWDGPAAVAFADGTIVGAALDRNGLRPLRYCLLDDGLVIAGSEVGTVDLAPESVRRYGKLGPGQMLAVDLESGTILENKELKEQLSTRRPYRDWVREHLTTLDRVSEPADQPPADDADLQRRQRAFGYTSEEVIMVLRPMVENAKEPTGSMGDDTPIAVLSEQPRPLFHYFKERFAEVTNPPIDHLRERLVFSLRTLLGPRANILEERPEAAHLIEVQSPILLDEELTRIEGIGTEDPHFRVERLSTLFDVDTGPEGLESAVESLCRRAEAAVDAGAGLLVLSDRDVNASQAPIPALLATGAVHHHLMRVDKRMRVSLIVESGEPREVHHFATLLGYGASAVNPYLALATVRHLVTDGRMRGEGLDTHSAQENYRKAAEEGLLKVMSKMGIATVDSYTGAQIFEAVGLSSGLIERCFRGTPSTVEGNGFPEIARIPLAWHDQAFRVGGKKLVNYGFYKPKKGGEFHEYTSEAARLLQKAVGIGQDAPPANGRELYNQFVSLVRSRPSQLRDLIAFRSDREPIPLDEVEPAERILRRFSTAQMSLGALSPEAHVTLAIAMNRLGGRSGSGEGGEDAERFGNEGNSRVKQIASGRFGVTPAYLASATELQIKMAQGSKPGEGGQIPGHKVTDLIARLRHTVPGVALISPPPHHDIYSIEDLAQLIYDLKSANPDAELSVKLVAQSGVGIIASGVAKGYADIIVVSGASGGTGSSPLNSIKNAGLPWEIGLAETQQALMANNLRDRVAIRVDGGMRTGRDIIAAALLGADEFSFGTIAMIAEGCIMARVCHTNNCPVGVASQRPELREKFPGRPENVMAYMVFVAEEVREILASLGYRSIADLIGRTDLLEQVDSGHEALDRLDLSPLLAVPAGCEERPRRRMQPRNPMPEHERLDEQIIEACRPAIDDGRQVKLTLAIENVHRTVGATLAWTIAKAHGDAGLPDASIQISFTGAAGQSFGAFLPRGVQFGLEGQANDYVGKGLAGGEITVRPHPDSTFAAHESTIVGNTVLYGATGGALYVAGQAGERFAVRNSGALAVVEGIGDHGCEYMTGGTVVVLGATGCNFGAGMTGGEAFILDEDGRFNNRYNPQLVRPNELTREDQARLRGILIDHYAHTDSEKARGLLRNWETAVHKFVRLAPLTEVSSIESRNEGAVAQ